MSRLSRCRSSGAPGTFLSVGAGRRQPPQPSLPGPCPGAVGAVRPRPSAASRRAHGGARHARTAWERIRTPPLHGALRLVAGALLALALVCGAWLPAAAQVATALELSVSPSQAWEGGNTPLTLTVALNGAARTTETIVIVFLKSDEELVELEGEGTFLGGGSTRAYNLVIPANQTSVTRTVTFYPTDGIEREARETLVLRATAPGTDLEEGLATLTILDNDGGEAITLSVSPEWVAETAGATTVAVTAALDAVTRPTATDVTVSRTGGTATSGTDYAAVDAFTVTIPANQTSGTANFTFTPTDDSAAEGAETVILSGSATGLAGDRATLTIADDDSQPTAILLNVSPERVAETAGATTVTVTAALDGGARPAATEVTVSRTGGTATSGTDYAAVDAFTVTIPANQTSGTANFIFTPTDDSLRESDETVVLSGSATGLTGDTAELTIIDDEAAAPVVLKVSPNQVLERADATTVTVTAKLGGAARATATTVMVSDTGTGTATSGTDYAAVDDFTVTIPANQTSGTANFTFTPTDDSELENAIETVVLAESAQGRPSNTAAAALLIRDDERPPRKIELSVSPNQVLERAGAATVKVTVELGPLPRPGVAPVTATTVTVSDAGTGTATSGTDYAAVDAFTVTVPADQTSATANFTFTPTADDNFERHETVILTGGGTGLKEDTATLTIVDPSTAIVLGQPPGARTPFENRGAQIVTMVATLNGAPRTTATTVTVSDTGTGTATSGTDYEAVEDFTLTIPAGQTSGTATFTLTPIDDNTFEFSEFVILSASAPDLDGSTFPVTLFDDEQRPSTAIVLSLDPKGVAEDAGATPVTVTAELDGDARPTATTVTVSRTGGTATLGTDYAAVEDFTLTIPADQNSGTATFTFTPTNDEEDEDNETVILRGRATGLDGDTAALRIIDNRAPTFANATEARSVAENTAAGEDVGAAVTATDTDAGDTLSYRLEGTDAGSFDIVPETGQILTKSALDHETQSSYSVTVKADDGQSGSATVPVTITVTDVDEQPATPAAPTLLGIGPDRLGVFWAAPDRNGGPALTGYAVQYKKAADSDWSSWAHSGTETSTTITGLDPGTAYEVQVRALNGETPSDWSPSGTRTTDRGVTDALSRQVSSDWSLVPSGLAVGDTFRLLFRSSGTRNATATDIGDYNTFVQNAAAAGHADIQDYSMGFRAVASTANVDARVNTGMPYTQADKGPPIYWLAGAKLADDYEDFYDGTWDEERSVRDENGAEVTIPGSTLNGSTAWTGSDHDGTEAFEGTTSRALGEGSQAVYGALNFPLGSVSPLYVSFDEEFSTATLPLYGLSPVFEVVAATEEVASSITGVALTSNAGTDQTYAIGEVVSATVTFSEAVTVDDMSGANKPQLELQIGDNARAAEYASGTGTAALVFSYTVAEDDPATTEINEGDEDADGIAIAADKLTLNGGTIKAGEVAAALTHAAVAADAGHKVDGVRPALSSAATATDGATVALTFGEALDATNGPANADFTVKVGGTAATLDSANPPAVSGSAVTLTLETAVGAGETVTVSYADPTADDDANAVQDAFGNDAASFAEQAVTNAVPAPAALTGLALTDGVNAVTLSPVFDAATLRYTASVTAGVTRVTVTPTPASGVTTGILDGSDTAIADADSRTDGHQVDVAVGANTFKVKVSATGKTAQDYTVTVTRAALPAPPGTGENADGSETVWGANLSVGANAVPVGGDVNENSGFFETTGVGGLAPDGFTAGGVNYTVKHLVRVITAGLGSDKLNFDPVPLFPAADDGRYVLDVGGTTFRLGAAARGDNYVWDWSAVTGWTQNAVVPVTLTRLNPPAAPTNLTATAGDTEVTLAWTAPAKNGGSAVTGYQYCQKENETDECADADWTAIDDSAPGGANAAGYTVGSLDNGTAYTFRVRAVNAIGGGAESNAATATPEPPKVTVSSVALTSDPDASGPDDDTYAIGDVVSATVTFAEAVTVDDMSGANKPQLELQIGENARAAEYASGTGTTELVFSYTVAEDDPATTTIDEGDEDTDGIAIAADKLTLNGGAITVTGKTVALDHAAVAADAAHKVDGVRPAVTAAAVVSDGAKVELTFGEALNESETPDKTAFAVTTSTSETPAVASVTVDGATVTLAVAPSVRKGATVAVAYTAPSGVGAMPLEDAAGNDAKGFASQAVTNAISDRGPDAPGNLTATARNGEVALAWETPPYDGGLAISQYDYRYTTDGGTTWGPVSGEGWASIAGSGAATTAHTVFGLTNGTAYTFEVRAQNGADVGAASEQASATPLASANASLDAGTPGAATVFSTATYDIEFTGEWTATATPGRGAGRRPLLVPHRGGARL